MTGLDLPWDIRLLVAAELQLWRHRLLHDATPQELADTVEAMQQRIAELAAPGTEEVAT